MVNAPATKVFKEEQTEGFEGDSSSYCLTLLTGVNILRTLTFQPLFIVIKGSISQYFRESTLTYYVSSNMPEIFTSDF